MKNTYRYIWSEYRSLINVESHIRQYVEQRHILGSSHLYSFIYAKQGFAEELHRAEDNLKWINLGQKLLSYKFVKNLILQDTNLIKRFEQKRNAWLEPLRRWLKDAQALGEITLSPELPPKKSSAQKIFGSNLFLKNQKIEFVPETQYAALCAAYKKIEKLPLNEILVGWVGIEPTTNGLKGRCSTD